MYSAAAAPTTTVAVWDLDCTIRFRGDDDTGKDLAASDPDMQPVSSYVCRIDRLASCEESLAFIPHAAWFRLVFKLLAKCGVVNVLATQRLTLNHQDPVNQQDMRNLYDYLQDAFPGLKIPLLAPLTDVERKALQLPPEESNQAKVILLDFYRNKYKTENNDVILIDDNQHYLDNAKQHGYRAVLATKELTHLFMILQEAIGIERVLRELNASLCDEQLTIEHVREFYDQFLLYLYGGLYDKLSLVKLIDTLSIGGIAAWFMTNEKTRPLAHLRSLVVKENAAHFSAMKAKYYLQWLTGICLFVLDPRRVPGFHTPLGGKLLAQLNAAAFSKWHKLIAPLGPRIDYGDLIDFSGRHAVNFVEAEHKQAIYTGEGYPPVYDRP